VGEYKIPLRIYYERRRNISASLGKNNVLLRIPIFEVVNILNHVSNVKEWISGLIAKDPRLIEQYNVSLYKNQEELLILGKDLLSIELQEEEDTDQAILKSIGNKILISLPKSIDIFDQKIIVRKLLAKYLRNRYKKFVEERINYWNINHFNKEINGVTIRDNNTNWGSCSYNKNINISTRSLLLPMEIFDYILVHELSHLIEMNHSYKFWAVVEKVMPNYRNAEEWIKVNGSKTSL
jgi:predicted metal-dependent hydrolase